MRTWYVLNEAAVGGRSDCPLHLTLLRPGKLSFCLRISLIFSWEITRMMPTYSDWLIRKYVLSDHLVSVNLSQGWPTYSEMRDILIPLASATEAKFQCLDRGESSSKNGFSDLDISCKRVAGFTFTVKYIKQWDGSMNGVYCVAIRLKTSHIFMLHIW